MCKIKMSSPKHDIQNKNDEHGGPMWEKAQTFALEERKRGLSYVPRRPRPRKPPSDSGRSNSSKASHENIDPTKKTKDVFDHFQEKFCSCFEPQLGSLFKATEHRIETDPKTKITNKSFGQTRVNNSKNVPENSVTRSTKHRDLNPSLNGSKSSGRSKENVYVVR